MANYEILIKAKLETKSIEEQLKKIADDPKTILVLKKITFTDDALKNLRTQLEEKLKNLKVTFTSPTLTTGTTGGQAPPSGGTGGGATRGTPTPSGVITTANDFRTMNQEIMSFANATQKIKEHFGGIGMEAQKVTSVFSKSGELEGYNVQLMKTDGISRQIYAAKVKINEEGVHELNLLKLSETSTNEVANALRRVQEVRERIKVLNPEKAEVKNVSNAAAGLEKAAFSKDVNKIKEANDELTKMEKPLNQINKGALSFGEAMKTAFERIVQWGIATSIVYGLKREIEEYIQYIRDLNKELTNARIVTGMNQVEAQNLGLAYNKLAKEMGVTTLEVAKGSLEWLN